jgi:hypothetical protein
MTMLHSIETRYSCLIIAKKLNRQRKGLWLYKNAKPAAAESQILYLSPTENTLAVALHVSE